MKQEENLLQELNAGCSACSWSTKDGKHLWGRNLDFNRMTEGTKINYVPKNTVYYTCGNAMEKNLVKESRMVSSYAAVGTGLFLTPEAPILYEGINEKGLMGGQLYYREFAHFEKSPRQGTYPLQPPMAVFHLLAQCASIDDVIHILEQEATLTAVPMLGTVPSLHWSFSDRTGESIVIEPDRDGLHIYRNTLGVMTNSPGYPWHRLNLLNYAGIRDLDYGALELEEDRLPQCFSGSGAQGLPGDWSSPSRFIRLAFLKKFCVKGASEDEGVSNLFHLFQSAAFPLGMVRVTEPGHITQLDTDVVPFDYTIYTAVMCAESLRFYWTTYENQRIQYADLRQLSAGKEPAQFDLERTPDFLCRTAQL